MANSASAYSIILCPGASRALVSVFTLGWSGLAMVPNQTNTTRAACITHPASLRFGGAVINSRPEVSMVVELNTMEVDGQHPVPGHWGLHHHV
ncbi:hypothetical protein B0H67DRAFT_331266 [Lasiosphaeris hirsuta]|uniref:Uncharacterized protein n=1 Tax=Lasiosphaeris hirsuta TaxID=260670 RepID=A0AA40A2N9_9PEZI|nr:hypothetical protein B0H67DRAFT_331266 [Lasiosphaeris hirsuta]